MRLTDRLLNSLIRKRPFYVTTPIFYVNASPHIGHLYSAIVADTIQRFERLIDPKCSVIFSTGTDEHGTKIQQAAAKHNQPLDQYCTSISDQYKKLFQDAGVEFTDYIRTTEERHEKAVQHFWSELKKRNYIYLSQYEGWYCVNDETFLTESHLREEVRDGKKIIVSADSGHPVEWTQEQNYMFKLSSLRPELEYWMKRQGIVRPGKFQEILKEYLFDQYLPDISISRPSSRVHWAIKVPDDPGQSIYVWLDALINYLTVVGYPFGSEEKLNMKWPVDVHVVGKDILKFHGLYWPAFLIAVGLNPPRKLLCHGHWTVDGKKMSKSLNNVVNPYNTATSLEALRYFLLREGTMQGDANYSELKMSRVLNSELADTLGNLLNRCTGKSLNPKCEFPPLHRHEFESGKRTDDVEKLISAVDNLSDICRTHYENYHFYKAVDAAIRTLHLANEFFDAKKPWTLNKSPEKKKELDVVLHLTLETIRVCSIVLIPIIPQMSNRLLDKLNVPEERRTWNDAQAVSWQNGSPAMAKSLSSEKMLLFKKIILDDKKRNAIVG